MCDSGSEESPQSCVGLMTIVIIAKAQLQRVGIPNQTETRSSRAFSTDLRNPNKI